MAKDILKSSIAYTILGFLPLSFALIFTPIYLNYLNETEYGILNLFTLYTGLIAQTYSLGVSAAFGYMYWDVYKDKRELKKLISSTLGLLLLFQLFFIAFGLLFGEPILKLLVKSSDIFTFNPYLIIALFFSAFMVYYEMFLYFFRNEGEYKKYAILSISTLVILTIGTLVAVVWLDLKALGAILGRTFGYGLVISAFLIFMIFKYGISFNFKKSKALLIFGIPLFINSIIGSFGYGMDRLLIERFDSLEVLGIYGFALVIITVIETLFSALNNALSPTLYKFINEFAREKIKEIQALSHTIILIIMLAVTGITSLLYPLMDFLIDEKYHSAAKFVPILATAFFWRIFSTFLHYPLYMEKKTKAILINQIITLLSTIALGYIGYQIKGVLGIAYAIYGVRVIDFMIASYLSKRVKKVNFNFKSLIIVTIILGSSAIFITEFQFLFLNKYIAYCFPLVVLILSSVLFLKNELKLIFYASKNRKELFSLEYENKN